MANLNSPQFSAAHSGKETIGITVSLTSGNGIVAPAHIVMVIIEDGALQSDIRCRQSNVNSRQSGIDPTHPQV
jgi:hypothetical protein